jgi:CubicO group peptidase (beta-lactamase class C family)
MQLRSNWQYSCVKKVRLLSAAFLISLSLPFFPLAVSARDQSVDIAPDVYETAATYVHAHEIDERLSKHFKRGEPGATVIISQRGVILFRKAYVLANTETKVPLRPELSLRTGSITKQFTAAAIMLLAEQGKLSLANEIKSHMPDYPEHGRHITIENLLTHTSGIRNYMELPQFGSVLAKDVSVGDAIAFFKDAPLQFQPGQRFSYSNSNYYLLGAIMKRFPASANQTGYGYGWFIRRLGGSNALEHGGDIGGFSADTWRFPKEEIFIAVLANSDFHEPAPDTIAEKIAKIILRH